jgi:hypothetical protein
VVTLKLVALAREELRHQGDALPPHTALLPPGTYRMPGVRSVAPPRARARRRQQSESSSSVSR